MFDNTAIAAAELLSYFGKNTAVRIDHKYGTSTLNVVVARTGNLLSTVLILESGYAVDELFVAPSLESVANLIKGKKNFPRPRNMKRSWSPIRLNAKAEAMMEADSGIRFA